MAMYEEDKAHQFLMGLNDDAYSTIQSQILAMDPLPSLDRIFNITLQEENHKQVVINRDNVETQPWRLQSKNNRR